MPVVNTADDVRVGTVGAAKVYAGTTVLWTAPPFDIFNDIAWHSLFDPTDPSWTPPADGGAVSSLRNAGTAAADATQGTGAAQPTYRAAAAAFNNEPTIDGDGGDWLTATFASLSQPFTIWAVGSVSLPAATNGYLWGGSGASNRADLYRNHADSRWGIHGGTNLNCGFGIDDNPHLFMAEYNGASSKFYIDGTLDTTGDAGTNTIAALTLLATYGGAAPTDGQWATGGIYTAGTGLLSGDGEYANLKTYLAARYALTIA